MLRERERLDGSEDVRRGIATAMGSQWAWSGPKGAGVFKRWMKKLL